MSIQHREEHTEQYNMSRVLASTYENVSAPRMHLLGCFVYAVAIR